MENEYVFLKKTSVLIDMKEFASLLLEGYYEFADELQTKKLRMGDVAEKVVLRYFKMGDFSIYDNYEDTIGEILMDCLDYAEENHYPNFVIEVLRKFYDTY